MVSPSPICNVQDPGRSYSWSPPVPNHPLLNLKSQRVSTFCFLLFLAGAEVEFDSGSIVNRNCHGERGSLSVKLPYRDVRSKANGSVTETLPVTIQSRSFVQSE